MVKCQFVSNTLYWFLNRINFENKIFYVYEIYRCGIISNETILRPNEVKVSNYRSTHGIKSENFLSLSWHMVHVVIYYIFVD